MRSELKARRPDETMTGSSTQHNPKPALPSLGNSRRIGPHPDLQGIQQGQNLLGGEIRSNPPENFRTVPVTP
jgi:hypothetical protein